MPGDDHLEIVAAGIDERLLAGVGRCLDRRPCSAPESVSSSPAIQPRACRRLTPPANASAPNPRVALYSPNAKPSHRSVSTLASTASSPADERSEVTITAVLADEFGGAPESTTRRGRYGQGTQRAEQGASETVEGVHRSQQRIGDRGALVGVRDRIETRRTTRGSGGEDVVARCAGDAGLVGGGDHAGLEDTERRGTHRRRRRAERGGPSPHVAREEVHPECGQTLTGRSGPPALRGDRLQRITETARRRRVTSGSAIGSVSGARKMAAMSS